MALSSKLQPKNLSQRMCWCDGLDRLSYARLSHLFGPISSAYTQDYVGYSLLRVDVPGTENK